MFGSRLDSTVFHGDIGEAARVARVTLAIGRFRLSTETADHGIEAVRPRKGLLPADDVDPRVGCRLAPRP
ncbi:MAG: hypothetical protein HXX10_06740 [Rhodoplanes sp.]|uniref:hypothetical protein n=1 Tax=Rhodoplanes sp. TaxID=1968906 RepID=UPI0017FD6C13|nr:hypothetical protein [Rhodoplanes sp.]NVO13715.1 hypothetical protein [Rhodoplanes sp.]